MKKLNIWIDVTNSPHVLFFKPLIKEFEKNGHKVTVTARNFAQTIDLLKQNKIKYTKFSHHGGKSLFKKIFFLFKRSYLLYKFSKNKHFDLALSHNSVDVCIASYFRKIPVFDLFDYEFAQFHHINFRLSKKIFYPKFINLKDLKKYGANKNKIIKYDGLKEQMVLKDYNFDKNIFDKINFPKNSLKKYKILLRPPATMALYHRNIKNQLYLDLINYLSNKKNLIVIFMPRTKIQLNEIQSKNLSNFLIVNKTIDGPSLIKQVDLVISGGGTMNREAVALNKPVYSILALKLGGVDKYLIKNKYLIKLNSIEEFKLLKNKNNKINIKYTTPKQMCDLILKNYNLIK